MLDSLCDPSKDEGSCEGSYSLGCVVTNVPWYPVQINPEEPIDSYHRSPRVKFKFFVQISGFGASPEEITVCRVRHNFLLLFTVSLHNSSSDVA